VREGELLKPDFKELINSTDQPEIETIQNTFHRLRNFSGAEFKSQKPESVRD
jgi:hypothetical protein